VDQKISKYVCLYICINSVKRLLQSEGAKEEEGKGPGWSLDSLGESKALTEQNVPTQKQFQYNSGFEGGSMRHCFGAQSDVQDVPGTIDQKIAFLVKLQ